MEDVLDAIAIEHELVTDTGHGALMVAEAKLVKIRDQTSNNERPNRWVKVGVSYGHHQSHDLCREFDCKEPLDTHMAGEGQQAGRVQASDDAAERQDGK